MQVKVKVRLLELDISRYYGLLSTSQGYHDQEYKSTRVKEYISTRV